MINPTRINLINTRKRIAMARKGHSVLKRKREVLVIEFLKMLKQSRQDRSYLNRLMESAYKSVTIASAYAGDLELQTAAMHVPEAERLSIGLKGIMGVQIPEIAKQQEIARSSYNLVSTSIVVDDVNESFRNALAVVVDVAQRELGLRKLVLEIEKTKRRVNALEYRIIPTMKRNSRYISMRLDEIDRDNFSALKHVKRKLQKNAR